MKRCHTQCRHERLAEPGTCQDREIQKFHEQEIICRPKCHPHFLYIKLAWAAAATAKTTTSVSTVRRRILRKPLHLPDAGSFLYLLPHGHKGLGDWCPVGGCTRTPNLLWWPPACWLPSVWYGSPRRRTARSCLHQSAKICRSINSAIPTLFPGLTPVYFQSIGPRLCPLDWHVAADSLCMAKIHSVRSHQMSWHKLYLYIATTAPSRMVTSVLPSSSTVLSRPCRPGSQSYSWDTCLVLVTKESLQDFHLVTDKQCRVLRITLQRRTCRVGLDFSLGGGWLNSYNSSLSFLIGSEIGTDCSSSKSVVN